VLELALVVAALLLCEAEVVDCVDWVVEVCVTD